MSKVDIKRFLPDLLEDFELFTEPGYAPWLDDKTMAGGPGPCSSVDAIIMKSNQHEKKVDPPKKASKKK